MSGGDRSDEEKDLIQRLEEDDETLAEIFAYDLEPEEFDKFLSVLERKIQEEKLYAYMIDISGNIKLEDRQIVRLAQILSSKKSPIVELNLSQTEVELEGLRAISAMLSGNKEFISLDISNISLLINEDGQTVSTELQAAIDEFSNSLKACVNLEEFYASENNLLGSADLTNFAEFLSQAEHLATLDLSNCDLGNEQLLRILDVVPDMLCITNLGLQRHKGLKQLHTDAIVRILNDKECSIKELGIFSAEDTFEEHSARYIKICKSLKQNTSIEKFSVGWELRSVEDFQAFNMLLEENQTLQRLTIAGMHLEDIAETSIYENLRKTAFTNNTLLELRMIYSYISIKDTIKIINLLPNLRTLFMQVSSIGYEQFQYSKTLGLIVDAYFMHDNLRKLDVHFDTIISQEDIKKFKDGIRRVTVKDRPSETKQTASQMQTVQANADGKKMKLTLAQDDPAQTTQNVHAQTTQGTQTAQDSSLRTASSMSNPSIPSYSRPQSTLSFASSQSSGSPMPISMEEIFIRDFINLYWHRYLMTMHDEEDYIPVTEKDRGHLDRILKAALTNAFGAYLYKFKDENINTNILKKMESGAFCTPDFFKIKPGSTANSSEFRKAFEQQIKEYFSDLVNDWTPKGPLYTGIRGPI